MSSDMRITPQRYTDIKVACLGGKQWPLCMFKHVHMYLSPSEHVYTYRNPEGD